ncbi:MAG: glycosyl hydrolase family 28-related protein [Opitutaceae bacterium]
MLKNPLSLLLIALSAVFAVSRGLAQETLLDENFSDGELTGGSDPLDATWFAATASTAAIVDDAAGLGAGNALQYLSSGNFSRVTAALDAPIALAEAGDLITISLRLRMTRFSASNDGGFRFGLHNDSGEPITGANLGQSWTDLTDGWDGYYFRIGVGTAAGMRIYKDLPVAGNSAMGGSGDVTVGNGTAVALDDMAVHTARIEIERTAGSQNELRFFWDGVPMVSATTTTSGGEMSAFTNLTIGTGSTEVDTVVDDIRITLGEGTTVVEPIDLQARLVDWTRAGVEGGIPDYANIIDFGEAGGDATGQVDNTARLQSLISNLTEDTVIYFPAGVFRFDRRIRLADISSRDLPGVILRGAGTRDTKLLFMDPVAEDSGLFDVSGYAIGADIPIVTGLTKDSTSITLQSAAALMVGDWIAIRQDNDYDAMATTRNIPDYLDSIDNATGYARRVVGQVVKVTAIEGNVVMLDRGLHLDFTWANPTVTRVHMIEGVGFEDLTLENGLASAKRMNSDFLYAANCWIRNVHSLMAMRFHVATELCANLTISDSFFNDAFRHDGGGHGYGTLIADTTTHCLIENNVFQKLRHSMIWKEGATGNVFAYNYSFGGEWDSSGVPPDLSGHGHYAFANLLEGNIVEYVHASDYWGPIGPNNVFLRNRVTLRGIDIDDRTFDQNVIGNELVSSSSPFVAFDGTSTGGYAHGNSEDGVIVWRPGEPQEVAESYFYSGKPAFWDIPDPWPSLGPEQTAGTYTIPAKYRWDNGLMEEFVAPVPEISGQPVSAAAEMGGGVVFSVEARLLGEVDFQWKRDGVDLSDNGTVSGSKTPSLVLSDVSLADQGIYRLVITNPRGSTTSDPALLSLWSPDDGVLSNLSTRGQVLSPPNILIGGFVIVGDAPKTMLVRGIGPSMGTFVGPEKALPDSMISLTLNGSKILENDDWGTQPDAEAIASLTAQVSGFPLEPDSKDAVLLADLGPGVYSARLGAKEGSGIGLVELYDGGSGSGDSRLMNISTRGRVGLGDAVMIPGIVVTGNSRRLLIRGVGPELAVSIGLDPDEVLADPVLTLKDADGLIVTTNDDWGSGGDAEMITMVSQQVGAFPLTPGSADAVLLVDLPAGVYTAKVSDATGGEGISIVEVYAAP